MLRVGYIEDRFVGDQWREEEEQVLRLRRAHKTHPASLKDDSLFVGSNIAFHTYGRSEGLCGSQNE